MDIICDIETLTDYGNYYNQFIHKDVNHWKSKIEEMNSFISGEIVDHEIITEFKFFITAPTLFTFFIDDKQRLCKELVLAQAKKLETINDFKINPKTDMLYYIAKYDKNFIIRFARANNEIFFI